MPSRFLSFHNAHAALFEYYHGPERKVYIDPRLEVAGADLFRRYTELQKRIKDDKPGWEAELAEMGRPVILLDQLYNSKVGGTLFRSDHWRCVWFDAIAAVFVHDSCERGSAGGCRRFRGPALPAGPIEQTRAIAPELIASSKAIAKYVILLGPGESEKTHRSPGWALDDARALLQREPDSFDGWINLGVIELFRELPRKPVARFRAAFDPMYDLSIVRATYALRRAHRDRARQPAAAQHAEGRL